MVGFASQTEVRVMNLPKDWSKKPDWLQRNIESNEGAGHAWGFLFAAILVLAGIAVTIYLFASLWLS